MKPTRDAAIADRPLDLTGRDGAIDFAARDFAAPTSDGHASDQTERFARLLGTAVIDIWSELPRAVQELLFERAVAHGQHEAQADTLREPLAKFLHDHHARTAR
jgi:hypothetical protein